MGGSETGFEVPGAEADTARWHWGGITTYHCRCLPLPDMSARDNPWLGISVSFLGPS